MARRLILIYLRATASMFSALAKQAKPLYDNHPFLCVLQQVCLHYQDAGNKNFWEIMTPSGVTWNLSAAYTLSLARCSIRARASLSSFCSIKACQLSRRRFCCLCCHGCTSEWCVDQIRLRWVGLKLMHILSLRAGFLRKAKKGATIVLCSHFFNLIVTGAQSFSFFFVLMKSCSSSAVHCASVAWAMEHCKPARLHMNSQSDSVEQHLSKTVQCALSLRSYTKNLLFTLLERSCAFFLF